MAVTSPVSLSKVIAEFLGPNNLSAYVRGGSYVPNISANAAISTTTSGLALSQFLNTVKYSPITIPVNWGTTGTTGTVSSSTQTLSVPMGSGTIRISVSADSGGGSTEVILNSSASAPVDNQTYSVSNGATLGFRKVGPGSYLYVTVYDHTSGTVIGTWTAG